MSGEPLERWQRDVLARDLLDAQTLISRIAAMLYGDLMTRDRERRFFEEGGDFAKKIADAAEAQKQRIEATLKRRGGQAI